MKFLVFVLLGAIVPAFANEYCVKSVEEACGDKGTDSTNCNAIYGSIDSIKGDLSSLTLQYFMKSFDYLLLSSNFGTHTLNRPGFEKLYRKTSDDAWNEAIDLIKYQTTRGSTMDFEKDIKLVGDNFALNELHSLSFALDYEKILAKEIHGIHKKVSHAHSSTHAANEEHHYDPEITQYLEEKFIENEAETIRKLSGYTNDLAKLIKSKEPQSSLAIYLFDEYLAKQ
uniref:Ferritin n=1 Tax=Corethrella appendiculata TaxID=1370023 RepID=U5ETA4_9DIPT